MLDVFRGNSDERDVLRTLLHCSFPVSFYKGEDEM